MVALFDRRVEGVEVRVKDGPLIAHEHMFAAAEPECVREGLGCYEPVGGECAVRDRHSRRGQTEEAVETS
jgi:hypothetical protein